jgi:crossover junction endodeoxyribonuclease RuvC
MKIISVDPGYERCGFAVLERMDNGAEELRYSDCFRTSSTQPFEERLALVAAAFRALIAEHKPDVCALEKLYFTTNQKTAMRVAEVRGALLLTAHEAGIPIYEFGPNEIKVAVAGDGRGTKAQVMAMVPRLIRITKEIQFDDEFDAIAVGLTASASLRSPILRQ